MVEQIREQPKESVAEAAKHLVGLAKDFTNESLPGKTAEDAAQAFSKEWQSITANGKSYTDQVINAAAKEANGSWNAYMPGAAIRTDANGGEFITFHAPSNGATMVEHWGLGATTGEISASDKGAVSASVQGQNVLLEGQQEKSKK